MTTLLNQLPQDGKDLPRGYHVADRLLQEQQTETIDAAQTLQIDGTSQEDQQGLGQSSLHSRNSVAAPAINH